MKLSVRIMVPIIWHSRCTHCDCVLCSIRIFPLIILFFEKLGIWRDKERGSFNWRKYWSLKESKRSPVYAKICFQIRCGASWCLDYQTFLLIPSLIGVLCVYFRRTPRGYFMFYKKKARGKLGLIIKTNERSEMEMFVTK